MVWIVACSVNSYENREQQPSEEENILNVNLDYPAQQVKCGTVYMTDEDKTKTVKKNVIALSSSSRDNKKNSSKYTLAVGSSFGHMHSFLKDSEYLLKRYEGTKTEECLLLIQKPKSASKQFWKKPHDLSLSPDEQHQSISCSQKVPFKGPTLPLFNQNNFQGSTPSLSNERSAFKELRTTCDNVPNKSSWKQITNLADANSYSVQQASVLKQQKSGSCTELCESSEIDKNMGGIVSHSHGKTKGRVPTVPQKSRKIHNRNVDNSKVLQKQKCDSLNIKSDFLVSANTRGSTKQNRDTLSSDESYDFRFKRELCKPPVNGTQMTSSPKTVRKDTNISKQKCNSHGMDIGSENEKTSDPKTSQNFSNNEGQTVSQSKVATPSHAQPVQYDSKIFCESHGLNKIFSNNSTAVQINYNDKSGHRYSRNPKLDKRSSEPIQQRPPPNYSTVQKKVVIRPKRAENLSCSEQHANTQKRKSAADAINFERNPGFDKESVRRAQSMVDLNARLMSVVAEPKIHDSSTNGGMTDEFTGTQLMRQIHTYRDMQKSKSGSLPLRGKALDKYNCSNYRQSAQDIAQQMQQANSVQLAKAKHHLSLQNLPISVFEANPDHHKHISERVQTPLKPRRCLPQAPGDVNETENVVSEKVKSQSSTNTNSNTSTGFNNSNRGKLNGLQQGSISTTPSDYEVSALLSENKNDNPWVTSASTHTCNTNNGNNNQNTQSAYHIPLESLPDGDFKSLSKSGSFGSPDQHQTILLGGRLSRSGQTTLTSQSTIDSGYITTDPDPDMPTTSGYAKTLKKSAQSMYTASKLFKQTSVDHFIQPNSNVDNLSQKGQSYSQLKQAKDTHTRTWLENHPGSFMDDHLKHDHHKVPHVRATVPEHASLQDIDNNNNTSHKDQKCYRQSTQLYLSNHDNLIMKKQDHYQGNLKLPFPHQSSEVATKEKNVKANYFNNFLRPQGKSVSMTQGLNLIEKCSGTLNECSWSKSQPKFTGSFKDLSGTNKELVAIDTLKHISASERSTLPESWKLQGEDQLQSNWALLSKPSLFQLLQNYNLIALHVKIPDNFSVIDNIRLTESMVVLPSSGSFGSDIYSPLSPKGSYAKLGGPNSAFRPVSSGGPTVKSISMVTVMEISRQMQELLGELHLQKGDLIIELNDRLMMGEDLKTLTSMLQCVKGDLLLTIAREKTRVSYHNGDKTSSLLNDEVLRKMEQKINDLVMELQKKDRTLKQLNALLPWKQTDVTGSSADEKDQDLCSLSDDEYIV